jgi:hypothetical protein
MKPVRQKMDYEKVTTEDFVSGIIEDVQYEESHTFKGFNGAPDKVQPGVRFKFKLDGYQYPHYSRWMKFIYGEKANLYTKYISQLVENATPDMDLDIEVLKGLAIKTLWSEKDGFQNIETIRPLKGKVAGLSVLGTEQAAQATDADEF